MVGENIFFQVERFIDESRFPTYNRLDSVRIVRHAFFLNLFLDPFPPCHTFCKNELFTQHWLSKIVDHHSPQSVTYYSQAALGCIHLLRQS